MKKTLLVIAVAALGLGLAVSFSGLADARGGFAHGGKQGGMLERLDTDGDGMVSRAEYTSHFDTLDADGDGYVTTEEFQRLRADRRTERRTEMFTNADEDGDGLLSMEEFPGRTKHFAMIDADGDGFISRQEAREFQPPRDRMEGRMGCNKGPNTKN